MSKAGVSGPQDVQVGTAIPKPETSVLDRSDQPSSRLES